MTWRSRMAAVVPGGPGARAAVPASGSGRGNRLARSSRPGRDSRRRAAGSRAGPGSPPSDSWLAAGSRPWSGVAHRITAARSIGVARGTRDRSGEVARAVAVTRQVVAGLVITLVEGRPLRRVVLAAPVSRAGAICRAGVMDGRALVRRRRNSDRLPTLAGRITGRGGVIQFWPRARRSRHGARRLRIAITGFWMTAAKGGNVRLAAGDVCRSNGRPGLQRLRPS